MPLGQPKFNKIAEDFYLARFSARRYLLFQFIETLYRGLLDKKDGRIELIIDNILETNPESILEIGSGVFPMYPFLSQSLQKTCEYHICEANLQKVKYLQRKYPDLKVFHADALFLPYEDNYFDLVLSKGVFHHIDDNDPEKRIQKKIDFLKESKRILKKGGVNLLIDFYYTPGRFKDIFWHRLYQIILFEGEYYYSNEREAGKFFKIANYQNIQSTSLDTFKGRYYLIKAEK